MVLDGLWWLYGGGLVLVGLAVGRALRRIIDRLCDSPTPRWAGAVELATAGGWGWMWWRVGLSPYLVVALAYVSILVVLGFVDARTHRIPNVVVRPAILLALAVAILAMDLPAALGGAVVGGGFMLVCHLIFPRGMGMGDVRLSLFGGLALGPLGAGVMLLIALWLASIAGVTAMIVRRHGWGLRIPLGPFLAVGMLLAL
ncbi:MAG: A24 family peptidase [Chloroflexi bacterium]|nr:A24 family peptidase [Chloroflexota bacterium]MBU1748048.1 A24 family peptidase [Chloroflexota bacterium]